jgi:hypothetical protein
LAEYFALRQDMTTAFETPDQAGKSASPRVIRVLLAPTEQRLVATLESWKRPAAGPASTAAMASPSVRMMGSWSTSRLQTRVDNALGARAIIDGKDWIAEPCLGGSGHEWHSRPCRSARRSTETTFTSCGV